MHSCVQFAAVDASAMDNATFLAGFVSRFSEQMASAAGANTDAVAVESIVGGSLRVTSRVWFNDAAVLEPEAFATQLQEDVPSIFTSEEFSAYAPITSSDVQLVSTTALSPPPAALTPVPSPPSPQSPSNLPPPPPPPPTAAASHSPSNGGDNNGIPVWAIVVISISAGGLVLCGGGAAYVFMLKRGRCMGDNVGSPMSPRDSGQGTNFMGHFKPLPHGEPAAVELPVGSRHMQHSTSNGIQPEEIWQEEPSRGSTVAIAMMSSAPPTRREAGSSLGNIDTY